MSDRALAVCIAAHQSLGQMRKYGGLPFYTHPIAVHDILDREFCTLTSISLFLEGCMLEAALLHDVIEDTACTLTDLNHMGFRKTTIDLVDGLTDLKDPSLGNRAFRLELNIIRMKSTSSAVKAIKCCDIIHNITNIAQTDLKFARLYTEEKIRLLSEALKPDADSLSVHDSLYEKAVRASEVSLAQINKMETYL